MIENYVLLQRIALTLAVGALIGVEREWRGRGEHIAGLRTFMLVCLTGFLSGTVADLLQSSIVIYVAMIFSGAFVLVGYIYKAHHVRMYGITTEIAFLMTFIIGLMLSFESVNVFYPITVSIILTFILVSKESMHAFVRHLKQKEIFSAVVFAIITFVILPVLPNEIIDPMWSNSLNPRMIWLSMVLVLSISFAGYIAMKIFGAKRGMAVTGIFGGIASSTSLSISMSEMVRDNKKILYPAVFAVVVAASTMFLRGVVLATVINPEVGVRLLIPFSILAVIGYLFSLKKWKQCSKEKSFDVNIKSPLALRSAFKFLIFFTLILFTSGLAKNYFGDSNAVYTFYLIALIAGLIDIDAVVISMASLSMTLPIVAVNSILIAALSNTLSKWILIRWFSESRQMTREVGKIFSVMLAVGIILLLILARIF
jgi:uncharacterized membrane protein (DUF4010 family)